MTMKKYFIILMMLVMANSAVTAQTIKPGTYYIRLAKNNNYALAFKNNEEGKTIACIKNGRLSRKMAASPSAEHLTNKPLLMWKILYMKAEVIFNCLTIMAATIRFGSPLLKAVTAIY